MQFQLKRRIKRGWLGIGMVVAALLTGEVFAEKVRFDPEKDGFSFSNDTVREYVLNEKGEVVSRNRPKNDPRAKFTHACFLMSRSVMQFHKFAEFAPDEPRLSKEEYRRRILKIFRRSLWRRPPNPKIRIPGYANLWEFSEDYKDFMQEHMGSWRMSYLRVGNYRMGWGHPRSGQSLAARRLILGIDKGELQGVYLSKFPKMNHCVVVYDYKGLPGGDIEFHVYDPNYAGQQTWLKYHAKKRSFELEERWYYNRGWVNVMPVFKTPLH